MSGKNRYIKDPLLLCLAHLTTIHGHSKSPEALISGLPWDGKPISADLFMQAAARVNMDAKLVHKRKTITIPPETLPCIILLQDGVCCILLEKTKKDVTIWTPQTQDTKTLLLKDFQKNEAGTVIFVKPKPDFIDRDLKNNDKGKYAWFWRSIKANKKIYRKVILASLLINLFVLASPIYIMNVYDRVIPNNAIETGWALALGVLIVFTFDFIIRNLRGYFIDFAGRNTDVYVTCNLFDKILDMKLSHRPVSSGAYANILREFDSVRDFLTSATLVALIDLPFSLLFIAMIFVLGGNLGFIVLILMAIVMMASLILQIPLAKHIRNATKAAETKHGLLVETIYGLEGIKAMNADGKIRAKYAAHVAYNANEGQQSRFYSALSVNISTYIQQVSVVFIVLLGMYMIKDLTLLSGALIACIMLSSRALAPVTQMANLMSRYHQAKQSLHMLDKVMVSPVERPDGQDFLYRGECEGHIAFDNVSFAYPNTDRQVLKDVSFSIEPGEHVGIVGRIGSGKSTIARLMLKLYDPASGTLLFDHTDYQQIDPADLRKNIAYLSQDVTLMRGTIRDNLTMGCPHATEDEILAACKISGAHDFISAHPLGYDAPVGERGDGLSGGQKQCIALARASLMNPSIYVCDEPTNAMDLQTEENFACMISEKTKNKTLVLITHRTSLLPLVDRLILIDEGKIIADGKRDEVIKALSGSTQKQVSGAS